MADTMRALVYRGNEDVRVEERPRPVIGASTDAIVRVTRAAICGSDLHLYHGDIPDTKQGDVLGHEAVGVVEEVGRDVRRVRPGDRVVVAAIIACGECWYCRQGMFSLCDTTNPNPAMQELYGHATAGIFGYSHLTGGYDGGQAEYLRVPYADVGCFPLPDAVSDDQGVLLADVMATGWWATDCAGLAPGETAAVFGCGPIGLLAMEAARCKGVERLIAIDELDDRLDVARSRFGAETINFREDEPVKTLRELTQGRGPDACLDCAGFRYARSRLQALEKKLKLETDAIDSLADSIRGVRKGGTVAVIGDYVGLANHFPVGAMMEKQLNVKGGQVNVQRHIPELLDLVQRGRIDPTFVVTHHRPLEEAPEAYRLFDRKEDGVIKVLLDVADSVSDGRGETAADEVDRLSEESFPASDPPPRTGGGGREA